MPLLSYCFLIVLAKTFSTILGRSGEGIFVFFLILTYILLTFPPWMMFIVVFFFFFNILIRLSYPFGSYFTQIYLYYYVILILSDAYFALILIIMFFSPLIC